MCIGIQKGGLELELGIRAQVSDAHAISFSFPHQATALKFLQSSGTRILWRRLSGGCLRRIRNTIAGEDVPCGTPAPAPPPSPSATPLPPSTSMASPATATSGGSPAPPSKPATTPSWVCGGCCWSLGGEEARIAALAVAGVALGVGFGGGVGTGLGFGAGEEEVIWTERDGRGGKGGCLGHSKRPAVAVAGRGKGEPGGRREDERAGCAGVAFR